MRKHGDNIALVIKAREGNKEAFNQLIDQYYGSFRYIVNAHLHNNSQVEDVLQEALLDIYCNLGQLKEPAKFLAWSRVIINRKIWAFKKEFSGRNKEIPMTDLSEYQKHFVEKREIGPDPHIQINRHQEFQKAVLVLQKLPKKYKDVAVLHYSQGLDYIEIALLLNITRFTSDIRLRRARQMLQALWSEKELL
jgi:RNA polymerase sigma-70 factor (ECF subfamily)